MAITTIELEKALNSLDEAIDLYQGSSQQEERIQKAFRDACIQRFEYSLELSWKISMKLLGSSTLAAKPAIREMARNNLISNPEKWIEFIEHRNNTSHSYSEEAAQQVFKATTDFSQEARQLFIQLVKLQ